MAMILMFSCEMAVKIRPARPGGSLHPFADYGEQSDFGVYIDRSKIAVRQFQGELRLQRVHRGGELIFADKEAEILPVAGTGEREHFRSGVRQSVERPAHNRGPVDRRARGVDGDEHNVCHRRYGTRPGKRLRRLRHDLRARPLRREAVLTPNRDALLHQRRERPRMQHLRAGICELGCFVIGDLFEHRCVLYQPRISRKNAVDIRPDPQLGCIQHRRQNRSREVRTASSERRRRGRRPSRR